MREIESARKVRTQKLESEKVKGIQLFFRNLKVKKKVQKVVNICESEMKLKLVDQVKVKQVK